MTKYQFSKVKNVHYNFFSAERGFSSFPYNSLNCSFNTQDSYENILENRNLVKDMTGSEAIEKYEECKKF